MKTKVKKRVSIILTMALCITLGSSYVRADDTSASTAKGINVAYHTQEEIRNFCNENGVTLRDALTYAQEPVVSGDYSAGKLSDETLDSAVKMLNCVRYIAGISYNVKVTDSYNSLAQTATLVNYVNNRLSHYPAKPADMDESLYELGVEGASSSNIAWASWKGCSMNWTIVDSWMEDGDDYNIDRVGHRRWLINPKMKYTGFGAVSGNRGTYSAVYAFDTKNSKAAEYGVVWPAQNMPVEYFGAGFPWSVSMGSTVDISSVKVKLTRESDNKTWNFSSSEADGYFNVNNDGYGQKGCIIFRPDTDEDYEAGDVYNVSITGLGDGKDVSYSVNFFELGKISKPTEIPTTEPTVSPTEEPSTEPTITPTEEPSTEPTVAPTEEPGTEPTAAPTEEPGTEPTAAPTIEPTAKPTVSPTTKPSDSSKPAAVKIKNANVKKNKVTVYFKKVNNVSGYEVRYSTDSKFKKNVKKKLVSSKVSKTTITLKKSYKKCFIRMRAYTKKNGKKIYGNWGNAFAISK